MFFGARFFDHRFYQSRTQIAQAHDRLIYRVRHSLVQPLAGQTVALTGVDLDYQLAVTLRDRPVADKTVEVEPDKIRADLHRVPVVILPVHRLVDVQDCAAVLQRERYRRAEAVLYRAYLLILLDDPLHLVRDYLLEERWEILIVIIEGIAVDAAVLDYVLYRDLVQRALVQELYD